MHLHTGWTADNFCEALDKTGRERYNDKQTFRIREGLAVPKARISACMVLYHAGDEALRAVDCLDASDETVDVYLVDNTPEDDTAQRIRWVHPGVQVRPQTKNLGFGRGNNVVLNELESDYHILVNPDVTFEPDVISRMVRYMDEHPNVVILTPHVLNADGTDQLLPKKQPTVHYLLGGFLEKLGGPFVRWRREYTMADDDLSHPLKVKFATGCFLMIRTKTFKELKGFDERFFLYQEDSDLSRRAAQLGPIIYHPDMCVTHNWARENTRSVKGVLRQIRSVCQFFMKWGVEW